ncbi:MAG: GNAT family N-acetyltransferase [Gammaproteobacteria bacterium]|nr:GNAT family N-acetyltransferase [Gammaproteobacteria bacterium]
MDEEFSLRRFNIREADWPSERSILSNIRHLVFEVEQGANGSGDVDSADEEGFHWLATDSKDAPIGTVRLKPDGQIDQLAVLENFRGAGVGKALLEQAIDKARHLGLEQVELVAPDGLQDFCEGAGFTPASEKPEDKKSLHQRMVQDLLPLDDRVLRLKATEINPGISVKQFDTGEVSFTEIGKIIRKVREIVFVHELGLPESFIGDEADDDALHWVAKDESGQIVGVIRMSLAGDISHLAVMSVHRNEGVGRSLLELAVGKATRYGLSEVRMEAMAGLNKFLTRAGFEKKGEAFEKFDTGYQTYNKATVLEDVHEPLQRPRVDGDHYSESEIVYKLGSDKRLILLRREEDYRNVILEMAKQATTSIRVYSPVLEHKLFDNNDLRNIFSALARKNRNTHIEILLFDSHRMTRNGHALLEVSRKLSSSIKMKIVHPELRQLNHEYMLVDDTGIVYRLDYEVYDGYANFSDITECNRLGRQFTAAWESGLSDPNLRQLRM